MLVIRMQRTGRKGRAMFRMVVQDSRQTPTSGKVVAWLGSYDPHQKLLQINKEKAQFYLDHGAQPSQRAIGLLKDDGLKMPKWITIAAKKQSSVRNPDKRRSTRPAEEAKEESAEEQTETVATEEVVETEAEAKTEDKSEQTEKPEQADKTEDAKPEKEEPKEEETEDKKVEKEEPKPEEKAEKKA